MRCNQRPVPELLAGLLGHAPQGLGDARCPLCLGGAAIIQSLIQPTHFPSQGLETTNASSPSPENKTNPYPQTSSARLSHPISVPRAEPLDQLANSNIAPFLASSL